MKRLSSIFSLLMVAMVVLSACGTATLAATDAPAPTPTEAGPQIGGTYVYASPSDFVTLDIQKSIGGVIYAVWSQLGASLIVKDPTTNEFVPYLAEKWEVAPDGMSYTFTLRKDVKFHDGTPLTADDYVFTFQRILNPETASPTAGAILLGVSGAEKVDEYTFKVSMAMPNSTILENLSNMPFFAPYPKAYFEKVGADEFAKHPISVGPFKFKEYVTGDHLTLERNPDFTWGPSFTHGGPAYIENVVYRIIPEQATILAGLEAGEIDESATDQYADADRIEKTGNFTIYKNLLMGSGTELDFNHARAPFDDVNVRQAFNYAFDREALLQVAVSGNGVIQFGPLSESTSGYWPGVKDIGYTLDLAKAKSLLEEAGYTFDANGMASKDGNPFKVELLTISGFNTKDAQVLQEQLKALGVEVAINQAEMAVFNEKLLTADYDIALGGWGWDNYSLLLVYTSGQVGALNRLNLTDPELDTLVMGAIFTGDQAVIDQSLQGAQKRIVEQANIAPLYTPYFYALVSNRVEGELYASRYQSIWLFDAHIK